MNDFFTHQAIQKNIKATDDLNKYLSDLKALTNGDLAIQASKDLTAALHSITENAAKMTEGIEKSIDGLRDREETVCHDLAISILAVSQYQEKLRPLLMWGWVLFSAFLISGTGVLCYVAYHVH